MDVAWARRQAHDQRAARQEPSELEAIKALRPPRVAVPRTTLDDTGLCDRILGAWTARCCGCLAGKPVEGWTRARIRDAYEVAPARVTGMPEDDDLDWTVVALLVLEAYGPQFTSDHVARVWLDRMPVLRTHTAERVAYRNLCAGRRPPRSARWRNPYREWIGATIRADLYGWISPGDPERAADLAWRDARVSHVRNGIYAAMWAAATIASAFVAPDVETAIRTGLSMVPSSSRLAVSLHAVLDAHAAGTPWGEVVDRIHDRYDETDHHDWCHAVSNAMVVTAALLWGEDRFVTTVRMAVESGFDTDCNGATAGSILGARHGSSALPETWSSPLNDRLETGLAGCAMLSIKELAERTLALV